MADSRTNTRLALHFGGKRVYQELQSGPPSNRTDLVLFRSYDVFLTQWTRELDGSGCRFSLSRPVRSRGVGDLAVGVPVVIADPGHGERQSVFVAALGYEVKLAVGAN